MALNAPRSWLITYDIANPRRLARLHRFLLKQAVPVQYSVFHYQGSAARMGQLMLAIETRINPKQDDVRAYQLSEHPVIDTIGRCRLPDDVHLLDERSQSLLRLLHTSSRC